MLMSFAAWKGHNSGGSHKEECSYYVISDLDYWTMSKSSSAVII